MDKQKQQEAYRDYVKWKTPVHNLPLNMAKAFVTGGTICLLGQMILNKCEAMGLDQDVCGSVTSVSLILLSVLLTGWNLYPRIAKWGGAGALVPITGFANSIVSPAMEYNREGIFFGVCAKMFTIAGPIIVIGIAVSVLVGIIGMFL